MRIALDAMGGDNAPNATVLGAHAYHQQGGKAQVCLFGNESQIRDIFSKEAIPMDGFDIVHCETVVSPDEKPSRILRGKPNSSLVRSVEAVAGSDCNAAISAGNTGGLLAVSLFLLKMIKGIRRPALAPYIPSRHGGFVLTDAGANTDVRPVHLMQFGITASSYLSHLENIENPRVALLNIGAEENKGNELCSQAYPLMQEHIPNFIGNIEGRELMDGKADVVVADGFVGNIVLKLMEGLTQHMLSWVVSNVRSLPDGDRVMQGFKPAYQNLIKTLDYEEHGGTPLLGINGIVIKCHGAATHVGIKNSLFAAERAYDNNFVQDVAEKISQNMIKE